MRVRARLRKGERERWREGEMERGGEREKEGGGGGERKEGRREGGREFECVGVTSIALMVSGTDLQASTDLCAAQARVREHISERILQVYREHIL